MEKFFFFIIATLACSFTLVGSVYDFRITNIDGTDYSLSNYQGRKLLLIVLPSTQTTSDSALLQMMDSMSLEFGDSITIVGIPSYEDGYQDDSLQSLSAWYKSLAGDSVVLVQGMNTRKNSPYQNELFAYLTDKDLNGHFDEDVPGAGTKYFIDSRGFLYAVIGPEINLSEELMQKLLLQQ